MVEKSRGDARVAPAVLRPPCPFFRAVMAQAFADLPGTQLACTKLQARSMIIVEQAASLGLTSS